MDSSKFQEAQVAYEAGDFRAAAKGFLASAGKGAVGNGAAYHMAGNALMRLRRYADAVTVYGHGLRDETYDKRGPVYANLGAAYVAMGELSSAITAYEAALAEPGYSTPYKAWQGIAAAHMERGKAEDAAIAYRRAALDEANPEPGKSLVNLGLCFMALGRPADAADAYKAALGFDNYGSRGKALANLGQAYTAMGEYAEAVKAFEKATQLHGHKLSAAAQAAYDTAVSAVGPARETVEGWVTGEMPPVPLAELQQPSGWATGELVALTGGTAVPATLPVQSGPLPQGQPSEAPVSLPVSLFGDDNGGGEADVAAQAAAALGFGDEAAVSDFFSRSEDEMKLRDREARRAERAGRPSRLVRGVVVGGIGAVVFAALVTAAYFLGLGWPMQDSTVLGLMAAYKDGRPVESYWVAVPDADVKREMAKVPPVKDFEVGGVDRGRDTSTVRVTVTPEKGAPMHFIVTLAREGVGWRVSGIDYNWRSTGG